MSTPKLPGQEPQGDFQPNSNIDPDKVEPEYERAEQEGHRAAEDLAILGERTREIFSLESEDNALPPERSQAKLTREWNHGFRAGDLVNIQVDSKTLVEVVPGSPGKVVAYNNRKVPLGHVPVELLVRDKRQSGEPVRRVFMFPADELSRLEY